MDSWLLCAEESLKSRLDFLGYYVTRLPPLSHLSPHTSSSTPPRYMSNHLCTRGLETVRASHQHVQIRESTYPGLEL
jgi:hypothetical protein